MMTHQSKLFGKTRKEVSSEEVSTNAQLLMRAGFIEKNLAGVYTYLPLGLRVHKKIEEVIRQEMNRLGAQEILMPVLQNKEVWMTSGRWQDRVGGSMYQFTDSSGRELGLGPTHEEVITDIISRHVHSYKDLPLYIYQIQTKFRDEPRAKSGLLRGREFVMKDLYSFARTAEESSAFYQKAHDAYLALFQRLGLRAFSVEASGGTMSKKHSHEFMVVTPAGEDITIYCLSCGWAQNKEIATIGEGDLCPRCQKILTQAKTVEGGNIFDQEILFTSAQHAQYADEAGVIQPIYMGAYGIGVGRAMGTIVEAYHDEAGIKWTPATTPYHVHVLQLSQDHDYSQKMMQELQQMANDYDFLIDDRKLSAGQKLAEADLIGIPLQVVIGDKAKPNIEVKYRTDGKRDLMKPADLSKVLKKLYAQEVIR